MALAVLAPLLFPMLQTNSLQILLFHGDAGSIRSINDALPLPLEKQVVSAERLAKGTTLEHSGGGVSTGFGRHDGDDRFVEVDCYLFVLWYLKNRQ